jgi:peroxiredoxin
MIRTSGAVVAMVVLASLFIQGRQSPTRIDVTRLGPQVGQPVPDFRLQDGQGKVWTRDSIMGPKGAMLVFSRSLDWCPYCKTQAIELQGRLAALKAQGLGVALITYDSPAVLADFARRRGITFPLLSDPGSPTIRAYGILNTTAAAGTRDYGIPFPGTFLLDPRGTVRSRFFEEAYQERNTVSTILIALGSAEAPRSARRIQTDHLDITTYLSDDVVAPGSLFSVVFDITPEPGIHVYAPGAKDYRVLNVRLDPNPVLTLRPVQYPASEIYHFKPLDERVEVFMKPFQLRRDFTLLATPEAQKLLAAQPTVTISGALEYQACDDKVCFNPTRVPLSFTLNVRALDRRPPGAH